jgi:hypothetical protein
MYACQIVWMRKVIFDWNPMLMHTKYSKDDEYVYSETPA